MINERRVRLISILIAAFLALAILYPIYSIAQEAFRVDGEWSFGNVSAAINDPGMRRMLVNTLIIVLGAAAIAVFTGTVLAVTIVALASGKGVRRLMLMAPLAPLTIPPLVGAVGWLFLLAPRSGWINVIVRAVTGSESGEGPFSVYSMWVVVMVTGIYVVPYVYTIMAASISRLGVEIVEAYQVNGSSMLGAVARSVVGPLKPAFLAATSLAVVQSLSTFSIPLIFQWDVLTTYMNRNVNLLGYTGRAAVVGLPLLATALAFTALQITLMRKGNRFATVSGRGAGVRDLSFGKVTDKLLKGFTFVYLLVAGVLPFAGIITVSLLKYWRPRFSFSDLTLSNFSDMATNALVRRGAMNSLQLALSCAVVATLLGFLIVILMERSGRAPARIAYFMGNLPLGFPHVLLGLGFLFAFISPPIVLYGSMNLLILGYLVAYLPISMRNIGPQVQQIGRELEEAAVVSGTSWAGALRKVTIPLAMPAFASSAAVLFVLIFREFPMAVFLSTSKTKVVSMSLLNYHGSGQWAYVAVIAIGLSLISAVGLGLSQFMANRYSIKSRPVAVVAVAAAAPAEESQGPPKN